MADLANSIWAQAERNNRTVRRRRAMRSAQRFAEKAAFVSAIWFVGAWVIWTVATAECVGCGL